MHKPQILKIDHLRTIEPLTVSQEIAFKAWDEGNNLVMSGTAGSGKTFLAMYMALEDVLDKSNTFENVVICRSIVPTREIGFLPGTLDEKIDAYTGPYRQICSELFDDKCAYDKLNKAGSIEFISTSHIRGTTISDSIIIVDEMQNCTFHELDSIITRVGQSCRIIFCGDVKQDDLTSERKKELSGLADFMRIIQRMPEFDFIEFEVDDIVRSNLVKSYIIERDKLGL